MRKTTKEELQKRINEMISHVEGYFRQKEILQGWEEFFQTTNTKMFTLLSFTIECSAGTYIRGIVHELGKALGTGAIALDIHRTKVGDYTITD